ncbi:MAG: nuclear transport factor 2 family protein, partial [Deltaproteobacteria bacterium]|nr:nuclear transport factor 2 family protein [Deltaproteobacteria bacterium]
MRAAVSHALQAPLAHFARDATGPPYYASPMVPPALEVVESWHAALNAHDDAQLCALTAENVELVGPRGATRGHTSLRQWLGQAAFTAEPLRWFCGARG